LIYNYLTSINKSSTVNIPKEEEEQCIYNNLKDIKQKINEEDVKAVNAIILNLPSEYRENYRILRINFLVNIVPQSLDSFGICNNKLAYAAKKETTNFFMIGDMASAYPAGISVEIGFRFVNYIIPMFYNFYINNNRTIANCSDLHSVDILDDCWTSFDYQSNYNPIDGNTDTTYTVTSTTETFNITLKNIDVISLPGLVYETISLVNKMLCR
jgi:hypothetical protein